MEQLKSAKYRAIKETLGHATEMVREGRRGLEGGGRDQSDLI